MNETWIERLIRISGPIQEVPRSASICRFDIAGLLSALAFHRDLRDQAASETKHTRHRRNSGRQRVTVGTRPTRSIGRPITHPTPATTFVVTYRQKSGAISYNVDQIRLPAYRLFGCPRYSIVRRSGNGATRAYGRPHALAVGFKRVVSAPTRNRISQCQTRTSSPTQARIG